MLESLPFLLSSFLYLMHFNSTVITSLPFFLLFPQVPPCPLSNRRPVDHNCYILADIQSRLRFTRLTLEHSYSHLIRHCFPVLSVTPELPTFLTSHIVSVATSLQIEHQYQIYISQKMSSLRFAVKGL